MLRVIFSKDYELQDQTETKILSIKIQSVTLESGVETKTLKK